MGVLWMLFVLGLFSVFLWVIRTVEKEIGSQKNSNGQPSNLESEATSKINLSDEATPNPELHKKASLRETFFLILVIVIAAALALGAPPPEGSQKYEVIETSTTTSTTTTTTTTEPGGSHGPQNQHICWTGSFFGDNETEERFLTECNP